MIAAMAAIFDEGGLGLLELPDVTSCHIEQAMFTHLYTCYKDTLTCYLAHSAPH